MRPKDRFRFAGKGGSRHKRYEITSDARAMEARLAAMAGPFRALAILCPENDLILVSTRSIAICVGAKQCGLADR